MITECKRDQLQLDRHLALSERQAFKDRIEFCRNNPGSAHISFDYAQKILLPLICDQPGPLYYITGLKMDLFGIADNVSNIQYNFALPEGWWPMNKTAEPIFSMLFFFITTKLQHVKQLKSIADNCCGQNKNRFNIWGLAAFAIILDIDTIELSSLIVGHTKNFCDACFGLVKRSLKGKDVLTPGDIVSLAKISAKCNRVHIADEVPWYEWKLYLQQFFDKSVPNLLGYQHFRFDKAWHGVLQGHCCRHRVA